MWKWFLWYEIKTMEPLSDAKCNHRSSNSRPKKLSTLSGMVVMESFSLL
jgi:hypothetical protein